MLKINEHIELAETEIEIQAIRAQGSGGQNVNKVSSAVHLRFDINASSLPPHYKERLLRLRDQRLSADGVLVIKAQRHRSQEKNRQDAIDRLLQIIRGATRVRRKRIATKPGRAAHQRRLQSKSRRARIKQARGRVEE